MKAKQPYEYKEKRYIKLMSPYYSQIVRIAKRN